jgi:hypothetical protein
VAIQLPTICVEVRDLRQLLWLVVASVHDEDVVPRVHELGYQRPPDEPGSAENDNPHPAEACRPYLPVDARGPLRPGREDLDAESIRIEDEECVVLRNVAVLLRRMVDPIAPPRTPLMRRVHLFPGVDLERQVFEPDAVVAMCAAVGGTEPDPFVSEAQIDDLLGAPVGRIALLLLQAKGPQEVHVERERPIDIADGEVDVLNSAAGHPQVDYLTREI